MPSKKRGREPELNVDRSIPSTMRFGEIRVRVDPDLAPGEWKLVNRDRPKRPAPRRGRRKP